MRRALLTAALVLPTTVLSAQSDIDMGWTRLLIEETSTPSNPAAGKRILFVNSATGEISVRTPAGATVSLEGEAGGGGGGPTVVRKTADQASTSTTFANVTDLVLPVSASTSYSWTCRGSYTTAVSTTALQLSVTVPASETALRFQVEMSTTATARHNSSQSADDAVVNPATGGGATALPWQISGTLENGANAGNITLRMRTEVSASAVTILRGAFCVLY